MSVRLDKFLKVSRIIKRRTVSNDACDAGRGLVNSRVAKASYNVKTGDVIEMKLGARTVTVKVEKVTEVANKDTAPLMYTVIE